MRNTPILGSALLLSAALLTLRPAIAATVTWDTSTAAGFQSGNGTWGTDNFWSTDGTTLLPWVSGDTASFLGQASAVTNTITVGSAQAIAGLTFGSATTSGNWTFSGSALNMSTNATFTVNAGSTSSMGNVIAGDFGLSKAGTGSLTLSGQNTYTGATTVSAGTLTLASGATMSAGALTVAAGASLVLNSSAMTSTLTGSGAIAIGTGAVFTLNTTSGSPQFLGTFSGAGSLVKSGGGEVLFAGDNSGLTGAITVNGGMISVQNSFSTLGSGDVTVTANATIGTFTGSGFTTPGRLNNKLNVTAGTLTLGRNGRTVLGNDVIASGTGSIVVGGGGTTVIEKNIANTGTGTLSVSSGTTLQLGNGGTTGTFNGGLSFDQPTGSLAFNRSDNVIYSGAFSGTGSLTQAGTGSLTLTGANTYTGATTVSAGTLTLASGAGLATTGFTVAAGANLALNSSVTVSALNAAGGIQVGAGATLTLNNTTNQALGSGDSATSAPTGSISGAGTFVKTGAGLAWVQGDYTASNINVILSGGTLQFVGVRTADVNAFGTGNITVIADSTLNTFVDSARTKSSRLLNAISVTGGTLTLGTGSTGNGSLTFAGGLTATNAANVTVGGGRVILESNLAMNGTGGLALTGGTLQIGNNTATGNINGGLAFNLNSTATLEFKRSDNVTYSGVYTGIGSLVQAGTNNLTLSGLSTYTGTTLVSSGTLTLASGASLGSGALVVQGGASLVLNANASTTALMGSGTVTIGSGATLTLNVPSFNPQFAGSFSGSGGLVKSGAGEALLAGDSSGFTGAITVTGGITSIQNSVSTLGSGDITVTGTATIGTFFGAAPFNTPGRLNNKLTVTGGTLTLGRNGTTFMGGDVIASGTGSIVVGGGGTIVIEKDIRNTGTGTLSVASGTTLQLGNGGTTGTFNGGLAFNQSAGSLVFKRSDNITYSGILAGSGALNQAGTGNLTLSGLNSYSGGTTVSSGTLTLASGGTLGTGAVTISDSGVVDLGGQTVANNWVVNGGTLQGGALDVAKVTASAGTISASLGGAGGFSKSGTGSVVLSGTNTYAGGTTLNGGTLTLGSGSALGTGAVALTSGTFNLNGQTIGNNLTLGAAVIDGSGTLSGVISGNAAFAKTGTTTLTFNGLNTYSGGTTVSAGTLIAGSNSALGSGAVTISGGTLDLGTSALSNTITLSSGTLAGSQLNGDKLVLQGGEVTGVVSSGALSKTSSGTVTLSGANTYAGGTTVSAGTLVVNNANALGAGAVTLSGGSLDVKGQTVANNITLAADSGVAGTNGTISGVISGGGSLTKSGTGTLTLSGNNTFEGGALVNAGTLVVNGEVLGNMVVSAAAKLAGSGIVHDVTVVAGGTINAGGVATVGTLVADTLSLQGGGKIELNFTNAALGAGNGFDRLLVSGTFDLSAAALASKCQLILTGLPVVFDPTLAYSFDFLKYGSLNLGGNNSISDLFTIDVSGLKDQLGGALDATKFRLVDDAANQRILLNYGTADVSPIPEPSTYGLSLGCLGLAIAAVRRRRRRRKAQD